MAKQGKTNVLSIVGFILAFLVPVVGIILCAISLGQIKKSNEKDKGLATAGLILSIIFTLFWIIYVIAAVVLLGFVAMA